MRPERERKQANCLSCFQSSSLNSYCEQGMTELQCSSEHKGRSWKIIMWKTKIQTSEILSILLCSHRVQWKLWVRGQAVFGCKWLFCVMSRFVHRAACFRSDTPQTGRTNEEKTAQPSGSTKHRDIRVEWDKLLQPLRQKLCTWLDWLNFITLSMMSVNHFIRKQQNYISLQWECAILDYCQYFRRY